MVWREGRRRQGERRRASRTQDGHAFRYLRDNGKLIGTNDLWIAATAIANDMPVVTRSVKHFRQVQGVVVVDYGP